MSPITKAIWFLVMVFVGLDVAVLRDSRRFWERLASNVGIVLLSGALYFRFAGS